MRFLVDGNLPPDLARAIRRLGIEARHVADLRMSFEPDPVIWRFACREDWAVVTKDSDFAALQRSASDLGGKLLWLRCGNFRKAALLALVLPRIVEAADRMTAGEWLVELP